MLLIEIELDYNTCKPYPKPLPILKLNHKKSTNSKLSKEII